MHMKRVANLILASVIIVSTTSCASRIYNRSPEARGSGAELSADTTNSTTDSATTDDGRDVRSADIPRHPSRIEFPELDWEIPLGASYRQQLSTGMVTYIAEDHELPYAKVGGYIKTGSILDPAGKEGLGDLYARMLRTGGTEMFAPDTLDELVERLAIDIGFSVKETNMQFSASYLSEYSDTALLVLRQMLFSPRFDENKLEKEKAIMIQQIRHRFDNPEPVLSVAYQQTFYPEQPNSRLSTIESVGSITVEDLKNYHNQVMFAANMIVSASGDFEKEEMEKYLQSFESKEQKQPVFPEIHHNPNVKATFVHKDINQAYVRMGLPIFSRPHPDYYPVSMLNLILGGGGFSSRLATRIRSDEGLTYSIYSNAGSNYTYPDTWYINFFTSQQTTNKAIAYILQEIRRLLKDGVTDEEMENARKVLIDGLPSMFRSPGDIVETYAFNEYIGRDENHFRVYPEKLHAITREDIMRVADTYLKPDSLTYTIVGDSTALLNQQAVDGFSIGELSPMKLISDAELVATPQTPQTPATQSPQKTRQRKKSGSYE